MGLIGPIGPQNPPLGGDLISATENVLVGISRVQIVEKTLRLKWQDPYGWIQLDILSLGPVAMLTIVGWRPSM